MITYLNPKIISTKTTKLETLINLSEIDYGLTRVTLNSGTKLLLQLQHLVIRIQTILVLEAFINVLVDELNNLKHKTFRDISIDDIGDEIPESEDNIVENNIKSLKHNQFI